MSERLSEKVAEQLKKAISEGKLKVGEKLPSQPDLDELKQILSLVEAMEKDFETGSIHYELDAKFHKEIAGATHNTILTHLIGSVLDLIRESIKFHREQML